MKEFVSIVLVIVTTVAYSQTKLVRGQQFELTGKIINEISLTPHCGNIAWGTVIEFEIIDFSKSDYNLSTIGIIFTCPELSKDNFFQVGQIYHIQVVDENQADFEWVIPNESLLDKYKLDKKFWMIKIERVK